MFVGVGRFVLQIPDSRSLKDKRRVVRSFKDRARARLPVAVAEVGAADVHQVAIVAAVTVSSDAERCQEVLEAVRRCAEVLEDAVLADVAVELVPFGAGGKGMRGALDPGRLRNRTASEPLPADASASFVELMTALDESEKD